MLLDINAATGGVLGIIVILLATAMFLWLLGVMGENHGDR